MTCDIDWLRVTEQPEWSAPTNNRADSKTTERYFKVLELNKQGFTIKQIAEKLKCNRTYIYNFFLENNVTYTNGNGRASVTPEQAAYYIDNFMTVREAAKISGSSYGATASAIRKERKRRRTLP